MAKRTSTHAWLRCRAQAWGLALLVAGCGAHATSSDSDAAALGDDADGVDSHLKRCGYREVNETANDITQGGTAEVTGYFASVDGRPLVICGQLDPRQQTQDHRDWDTYEFVVSGARDLDLRVELFDAGSQFQQVSIELWDAGFPTRRLYIGHATASHGVFEFGVAAGAGYWLVVRDVGGTESETSVPYRAVIRRKPYVCETVDDALDYGEGNEIAHAHRGNDMIAVTTDPIALSQTPVDDAPEPTGITLQPDGRYHLRGHSAAIDSTGDDYFDRDAFAVTTGNQVNEMEVVVEGASTVADLDLYIVAATEPTVDLTSGQGTAMGDDRITLAVAPETTYWLWVGAHVDAERADQIYDVAVCARQIVP